MRKILLLVIPFFMLGCVSSKTYVASKSISGLRVGIDFSTYTPSVELGVIHIDYGAVAAGHEVTFNREYIDVSLLDTEGKVKKIIRITKSKENK